MPSDQDRRDVAHLLRRTGFGARAADVERLADLGYAGAVDAVLDLAAPDPAAAAVPLPELVTGVPRTDEDRRRQREEAQALVAWWLQRMVVADRPFAEKLPFLWHDHFATSLRGVNIAALLFRQHLTLRAGAAGDFEALARSVAVDPAMLIWLDGTENRRGAPNENLARELFEVFTLGHAGAHGGAQPYTEHDVAEAARALTGWRIAPTGASYLDPARHDAGPKTVLGVTGPLGVDEVVAAAVAQPACAPYLVSRLYRRLARPVGPDDPVVEELAHHFASDLDVAGLLRAILLHPDFRAAATRGALVKTPIEWYVGSLRALGLDLDLVTGRLLLSLGQLPFLPPNVFGWPENQAWLSTASALVRLQIAAALTQRFDTAAITAESAAALLGVEAWGPATTAALRAAGRDGRRLLILALVAPEHLQN